ncbi:MAG: exo-alpha-sialidase [Thaumarchaeota archaeon]|nr:exo-alpha-sialidase [Nitrososphaerota archaeon]
MKITRPVIYLVLIATVIVSVFALSYYAGLSSTKPSSASTVLGKNETGRGWTTLNLSNDTIQSNNPQMAAYGSNVYVAWQACSDDCEIYFRASNDGGKSFGSVINLSNSTGHSTQPQIVASGNNVYAIWRDNKPGDYQVFFRASKNNGATFEPVIILSGNGTGAADYPQIIASGSGVYVSWYDNPAHPHLLLRPSADNGTSFGAPTDLNKQVGPDLRIEFGGSPQIAAHGSNVYFAWNSEYDIQLKVSRDYGVSFGDVVQVSNNIFTGWRAIVPKMVADENNLYFTWVQRRVQHNGETDKVFFTTSNDEGKTFSNLIELQGYPNVVPVGNNIYLTWTNTVDNKSTIILKLSLDRGKTFINETTKIVLNERAISQGIAVSGNHIYIEWTQPVPDPRLGQMFFIAPSQLFLTESADYGASFGEIVALSNGTQAIGSRNILASENRVYTVWGEGLPSFGKNAVNTEVIFRSK